MRVFLTTKCMKLIIHIFGSENNSRIRLFFSNPGEMKTVYFLHKLVHIKFEYKLCLEDILHG